MNDVVEEVATQPLDETLPNGSVIHWGDRDPTNSRKYGVTCGECGARRYTRPYPQRPSWSGFCVECSDASHRKSGDASHASGSVIHWSDRDPDAPSRRTAITCFKCERRVYHLIKTISSPRWSGLCGECTHMKSEVKEDVKEAPAKPLGCCCERCGVLLSKWKKVL
jgi:hypothetical protein